VAVPVAPLDRMFGLALAETAKACGSELMRSSVRVVP
jgi:hypothetical protein